ncbi:hypothetical protein PYCCODRAFT_1462560 [Trametes coccinea BRFM310]|uniref:RING-type domain-containing protein n=1 Tax=Trametes coccinea (strain BRFM310) TaxID=1353009 RepID=A0A1Y2J4F5_TRAC3|nr:hypothetical protein PYCCODRAFT_1462560 [Trametes coccinea BRFM310]
MAQSAEYARGSPSQSPPSASSSQAKAQTPPMALLSPWESVKILTVYIGNTEEAVKGDVSRRRLVASELLFIVQAVVQVILTIVFTVLGIVDDSPYWYDHRRQFTACLELAIPNILWLARTALACYLLLWAHWMQRTWKSRILANATSSSRHSKPLTGPEVAAILPCSRSSMLLHIRLTVVLSAMTGVLYAVTGILWILRQSYCRDHSPFIHTLSSIIYLTATLSYLAYFTALWIPSIRKQLYRLKGSPAADKLSRPEVDRLPLVRCHPSGHCDINASGLESGLSGFVPVRVPVHSARSTRNRLSTLLSYFRRSQPISLPKATDIEEGSDETPLLDQVDSHEAFTPLQAQDTGDGNVCVGMLSSRTRTGGDHAAGTESEGEACPQLRLLPCGHAFNKEWIDAWLTQRSSRCPSCQETVDVSYLTDDGNRVATDFLEEYKRVVGLHEEE